MAKIKLTKTAVESAQPQAQAVELRDTVVPGFLCKITPAGRRVFMLQYRTNAGERRKPALGLFGELTVEQARVMAQDWLAEVRRGGDPGGAKTEARKAPTIAELCKKFMEDYSKKRNKPSTQEGYQGVIDRCIIPLLGRKKVLDVKRPDIAGLMEKLSYKPTEANKAFGVLRKMFNLAEVWGYRPDGTNPCRHVPMFPPGKETRLIVDGELALIYRHLDKLEAEGLENYVIPLAIRLQFEFAARRSEVCPLEWTWLDFENRRVVWPDSKTGGMSKPMSAEAYRLLSTAPRREGCPYVLPSPHNPDKHLTFGEHYGGWCRVLKAAGVPHVGTHGIRHRSTTDIANSGVPTKVGMKLTGHKTVAMFMHYVHTEDKPVRDAAELVASRRQAITGARRTDPVETAATKPTSCDSYPNGYNHGSETQAAVLGRLLEEGLQGVSRRCTEGHGCGVVHRSVGQQTTFGQALEGVGLRCVRIGGRPSERYFPGGLYSEDGRCGTCTTCVPEEVQVRHRHAAAGRGTDREAVEGRAGPSQDEREINDEA